MNRLHVGAVLERPPGSTYRERLHYAELRVVGPPPKPATLARWQESSSGVEFGLVVPTAATVSSRGAFRMDDEAETALVWVIDAAKALGARWIVVPTAGAFTTGQRDRELFERWLDRFPVAQQERLVWHPSGLWDPDIAIPFARKRGLVRAFDPLEDGPGPGTVYARLRAIGQRQRFSETLLLDALDRLGESDEDEAWVTIESDRSFDEASRLVALADAEK